MLDMAGDIVVYWRAFKFLFDRKEDPDRMADSADKSDKKDEMGMHAYRMVLSALMTQVLDTSHWWTWSNCTSSA